MKIIIFALLFVTSQLSAIEGSSTCKGVLEKTMNTTYFIAKDRKVAVELSNALAADSNEKRYLVKNCWDQVGDYWIVGTYYESNSGSANLSELTKKSGSEKLLSYRKKYDKDKLEKECGPQKPDSCFQLALSYGYGFQAKKMLKFSCLNGHHQACRLSVFLSAELGPGHELRKVQEKLNALKKSTNQ